MKVFLVAAIVGVTTVGGSVGVAAYLLAGEGLGGAVVEVVIPSGSDAKAVGDILKDEGVVRSSLAFRLKARSRGLDRTLRAGTYDLRQGMSVDEAIDVLLDGPRLPETIRFTIPEGLTVAQTLERLAAATPHSVEDFRAVLDARGLELPEWVPDPGTFGPDVREPYEGLLHPETYEVRRDSTPTQILQRLVDQVAREVAAVPDEGVAELAQRGLSVYEALVIASLVEREAKVGEERPLISAVIHNRLQRGMLLQIDATVLYALGEHRDRVLRRDLEVESPYNTYRAAGLPPTPISGSGRASIRAAFDPADVAYLFYVVADEEGRHAFAETFEEHQENVRRYRELQEGQDEEDDDA